MSKYLDENGLLYFWQKIKNAFTAKSDAIKNISRSGTTFTATRADGTSFSFTQQDTTYEAATTSIDGLMSSTDKKKLDGVATGAEVNQNAFSNVKVGSTTVAADMKTDTLELVAGSNVTLTPDTANDKVTIEATDTTYSEATTSAAGLMSSADKIKLNGVATGAEVNQNAFANVKVGSTTIAADAKSDTLELIAGTNVTLTPDSSGDSVTIASSYTDTKNTAGSTDSSSKLYLIGAASQAANPQTYSQDTAYVGTDGHLYSNSQQVVNLSGSQALTNKTYNGYTLAAACAKAVDTSISEGSTSANVPTTGAVEARITAAIAAALTGAATFKGTVSVPTDISGLTDYKKGWYWVVATAGTYAGQTCESGDMIFCVADYASSFKNADFSIVQNNIVTITNAEIDAIVAA